MTDQASAPARPRPRAFRMEPTSAPDARRAAAPEAVSFEPVPDAYALEAEALLRARDLPAAEAAIEAAQAQGMVRRRRLGWAALFWSALGGLVSLSLGLWLSHLIEDLFARAQALGWIGVGLLALLGLAVLGLAVREMVGVFRQADVAKLHRALAAARLGDDREAARSRLGALLALYASRPEMARGCMAVRSAMEEIIDGADLIDIAERNLLLPLDRKVRGEIAAAAKRVSLVTAISPRAMFDLLFVAGQIVALIRRIAEIYSGRPGLLGFLKLARSVGAHLAVTGGMAVGDSIIQQMVGHGIAAKLSARLGEGVLNGLLTTRVGISAMAVCRPMPFAIEKPPALKDVAPFLFGTQTVGNQTQ